ncbi:MAG: PhnD/SsuA/transferrin family substrate-binding protein [Thermodesulfobacteriota bacterium]
MIGRNYDVPFRRRARTGMRRLLLPLCWFVAWCPAQAAWSAEPTPAPDSVPLVVGFSANVFADVDLEGAKGVAGIWTDQIHRRRFRNGSSETIVFKDLAGVEKSLLQGSVDLLGIISSDYMHLKDRVPIEPAFTTAIDNGIYQYMVLLVRKDAGFREIRDLRGKRLNATQGNLGTLHLVWLETLLMKEGARSAEEFFSFVKAVKRPSQAILPVFFRQADACLATRRSFELVCELNPQVGNEMEVLAESPGLVQGMVAFRPGYSKAHKEMVSESLMSLRADPQGLQLLNLFRIHRMIPFRPEHIESVEELFRQHRALRNRTAREN